MRRLFPIVVISGLLVAMASVAWAATNLNSSRSNNYRLVYPADVVTSGQAAATLKELDKIGPGVNEATLKQILSRNGVNISLIKMIRIIPATQRPERIPAILLLKQPADEGQAIAVSDAGCTKDGKDCSKRSEERRVGKECRL